jgi:hypothetical protein
MLCSSSIITVEGPYLKAINHEGSGIYISTCALPHDGSRGLNETNFHVQSTLYPHPLTCILYKITRSLFPLSNVFGRVVAAAEMVRRCGCAGEADFSDCGLYGWINV